MAFFNDTQYSCSAVVSLGSRSEASRAVRDKHMEVMHNNEVQVLPLP